MPSQWFIYLGPEEEDGPYTSNEMRNFAQLGNIGPDTPIRRHDMKQWIKAKSLTNLFPDGKRMPSGYYQVPQQPAPPPEPTPSGRMPAVEERETGYREQNETISMSVAELAEKQLEHDPDLAAVLGLEAWEEVVEKEVKDGRARVVDTETGIVAIDSGPPLPPEEEET